MMSASLNRRCGTLVVALAAFGVSTFAHAAASASDVAAGKKIAFGTKLGNCVACHSLPGAAMAGNVGPRLGPWVHGVFHSESDLVKYLYDPQAKFEHTVMPEFGKNKMLTDEQLQQVAAYVWSLSEKGERP